MALVRAIVRRGMGEIPFACGAPPEYELDFLATKIVFHKCFREFEGRNEQREDRSLREVSSENNCCMWKVRTAKTGSSEPFLAPIAIEASSVNDSNAAIASPEDAKVEHTCKVEAASTSEECSTTTVTVDALPDRAVIDGESSQQLVRVRARLGHLCGWTNNATEPALALKESIEKFMEIFFPGPSSKEGGLSATKPFESFDWVIETWTDDSRHSRHSKTDNVVIRIERTGEEEGGKWKVDSGELEAILSLWIASIKAEMAADDGAAPLFCSVRRTGTAQELPGRRRRRSKTHIGSRRSYCRIIGEDINDGSLRRNIAWWVSDQLAEQACDTRGRDEKGSAHGGDKAKLVIGFSGPSRTPRG